MASSSSSSPEPEATPPPWEELPREITAAILRRLGAVEMVTTAQNVCTTWRSVCRNPSMWRCIDMRSITYEAPPNSEIVCYDAVDWSNGELTDIRIDFFGTDDLLLYISERSSQLRSLRLVYCTHITHEGIMEAVKYLPLLEELVIHCIYLSAEAIETIGRSCPLLKSFKYNGHWSKYMVSNLEVQAIAKNMPALRHLQLFGNKMGNEGVHAILEGCPNLESLDLRKCFHVRLSGDLGKLCSERIRDLKLPNESTDDVYQFAVTGTLGYATSHSDDETSDDDYVKEKITRKQRNRKTKKQKQKKKNNKKMFD